MVVGVSFEIRPIRWLIRSGQVEVLRARSVSAVTLLASQFTLTATGMTVHCNPFYNYVPLDQSGKAGLDCTTSRGT